MAREEFKAKWEVINGKKVLVIKTRVEEITHPNGRKDVIVHAPSLKMISDFAKKQKEEK